MALNHERSREVKRLTLIGLLCLGILVGTISIARAQGVYGTAFLVEYSTDRAGGDISPGFPVSYFGECMDACASSTQCSAFTLVKTGEQPPNYSNSQPLCWLKDSVPGKRRNSGMFSGVKQ